MYWCVIFISCLAMLPPVLHTWKSAATWKREQMDWKLARTLEDNNEKHIEFFVWANSSSISLETDTNVIWSTPIASHWRRKNDPFQRLSPLILVVVNPQSRPPKVMATQKFLTGQLTEGHNLVVFLRSLREGALAVLIGSPDFLSFLLPKQKMFLKNAGSDFIRHAREEDPWVMAWLTESPTEHADRLEPVKKLKYSLARTSDYLHHLEAEQHKVNRTVPRARVLAEMFLVRNVTPSVSSALSFVVNTEENVFGCDSHETLLSKSHRQFCAKYEGYDVLCSCQDPYIPSNRAKPSSFRMKEQIPVAIVTANKPHHLYRLLRNFEIVHGSNETPFLAVIDGYQQEAIELCQLFGLDFRVHKPQGEGKLLKDFIRVNMNVGFALWAVFDHFPSASKAIILEDDLILSPDLLSFFHQTAPLLDRDEKLSHVNAFGQNSYPLTAADLTTLFRVEMYPQYGWMTSRRWFRDVGSTHWVKDVVNIDWDWGLFLEFSKMDTQSIVPEVSRTGHAGSAGAHVSGIRQAYYFDTRVMSNADLEMPILKTERLTPQSVYHDWMKNEIRTATKIKLTTSPCDKNIFPKNETGPFVLYLGVASRADKQFAMYLMQVCLGTEGTDVKELYDGVLRLNVLPYQEVPRRKERRILYLVGCPLSSLCVYSVQFADWIYPQPEMTEDIQDFGQVRREVNLY